MVDLYICLIFFAAYQKPEQLGRQEELSAGSRRRTYAEQLEGGLDGSIGSDDSDEEGQDYRGRHRYYSSSSRIYRHPSSTLHIRVSPLILKSSTEPLPLAGAIQA